MIEYKTGDLFTTTDRIIVHGVNTQGVMGAGVALKIKQKYPEAYKSYRDYIKKWNERGICPSSMLGQIDRCECNGKIIINAFTQHYIGHQGKFVSYDAIDQAMLLISQSLFVDEKISMPKIGAGLGGGHWPVIEQIINDRLRLFNVTVWSL